MIIQKQQTIFRFLKCLILFGSPFIVLIIIGSRLYTSTGDLGRLGKLQIDSDYRSIFNDTINTEQRFLNISEIHPTQIDSFKMLIIGDSFSAQGLNGYQQYLALESNLNILNFNINELHSEPYNPLSFLSAITDRINAPYGNVKYVVLQVVARDFLKYHRQLKTYNKHDLDLLFSEKKKIAQSKNEGKTSFAKSVLDIKWFWFYKLGYVFNDRAFTSDVYKLKLNQPLFSKNAYDLYVYSKDIEYLNNINEDAVVSLNSFLNEKADRLKQQGIQLVVMPVVDKYDLYAPYIVNNKYANNNFFTLFDKLEQRFLYINTKAILRDALKMDVKDIYYVDDSHWSPIGAKLTAAYLCNSLN